MLVIGVGWCTLIRSEEKVAFLKILDSWNWKQRRDIKLLMVEGHWHLKRMFADAKGRSCFKIGTLSMCMQKNPSSSHSSLTSSGLQFPGLIIFLTQGKCWDTLVKIPGRFKFAHPVPRLTIPIMKALNSEPTLSQTKSGPPLSPENRKC